MLLIYFNTVNIKIHLLYENKHQYCIVLCECWSMQTYILQNCPCNVSLKRPRQSVVSLTCKLITKGEILKAQLITKK